MKWNDSAGMSSMRLTSLCLCLTAVRRMTFLRWRNTGNTVSVALCQVSYAVFGQICRSLTVRAGWFSLLRAGSWLMCFEGNFPQLCSVQDIHTTHTEPPLSEAATFPPVMEARTSMLAGLIYSTFPLAGYRITALPAGAILYPWNAKQCGK